MSQSLVGLGIAVNFGFQATTTDHGVTATNLTGFLLQKSSYKTEADMEKVRALQGDTVSINYYDINYDATLTFVVSASTKAVSISSTAMANFLPGAIISITACASSPELVQSTWIVQPGVEIPQEITKSAELTLPLKRWGNVTAAQS